MNAPEPERQFFYMPYEHSEDPADQVLAVQFLTERMPSDPEMALHARAHQEVIRRYGRFPTRNEALGGSARPRSRSIWTRVAMGPWSRRCKAMRLMHRPAASPLLLGLHE
jgi:uncharacterized protein (DUF924 family)